MSQPRMPLRIGQAIACALLFALTARAGDVPAVGPDHARNMKEGLTLFKESVRPALVRYCLDCHGGKATKADFDISDRKPLIESGTIDGKAKETRLYALIAHREDPHMPHKSAKMPEETIEQIARWIELGAPYDAPLIEKKGIADAKPGKPVDSAREFWSFRPLMVSSPPDLPGDAWSRTPIDRFILAKQRTKGLQPNPIADKRALIRRATFDVTGLPPTPGEIDAFLVDPAPDAYEKLVDRLLSSPRYGERWASHWLDVARFAESFGYEQDYDRPFAYHYRDFLIRALNEDMPYDRLARWQVAGDELAPDDPWALAATGFLGGGAFPTQLTEMEFESARYDELDDMASTTGSAFLALTVGCARCHDHKFDPIPSKDYYRLASAFTTTIRSEVDLPIGPGGSTAKVQVSSEGFPHTKHHADDRGFPHFYPKTFVLDRGDVSKKKEEAIAGYLGVLERDGRDETAWKVDPPSGWTRTSYRRASLANWITDPEHGAGHLAARVMVNRLWQHHFGRGIVATPNDFGLQGERPTHPELLDWLATDLIHNGWKLKRLHKLIMTSSAYMQDGRSDAEREKIDREDVFLWRRVPRRLEAEPIRDAILAVSGLLDETMYGPGSLDPGMRRRSVYTFIKRSGLSPTLMLFDWPEHLVSIGQRGSTTTAPQALFFLNNPQVRLAAEGFAGRISGKKIEEAIPLAYQIAFGRIPAESESIVAAKFVGSQADSYRNAGRDDADRRALADLCQALMGMSEFVYVD